MAVRVAVGWMVCAGLSLAAAPSASGEAACFRTAHEAAEESGVRDGQGFRLEEVRTDALRGVNWALVRSCLHPEQPSRTVRLPGTPRSFPAVAAATSPQQARAVLVHSNDAVTMVQRSGSVRLEVAGVAQESRGAGERVHVRVGAAGQERVLVGMVQANGAIELEPAGVSQ